MLCFLNALLNFYSSEGGFPSKESFIPKKQQVAGPLQ